MRRPQGVHIGATLQTVSVIVRPILRVLTRRDWRGAEHLPASGGFVVAVNHVSQIDPVTTAHYLWDNGRVPRFLAKAGLFRVPVLGTLLLQCGQIPVYRESRDAVGAFSAAVQAIGKGECVVVYPEGTITRDPDLWPMTGKTGAARIALETGCPVVPIAQWGAQKLLAPYAKVPHLFARPRVRVLAGPRVELEDLRAEPATAENLRVATARITDAITALLEQLRAEQAPPQRYDLRLNGVARTGNPSRRSSTTAPEDQ